MKNWIAAAIMVLACFAIAPMVFLAYNFGFKGQYVEQGAGVIQFVSQKDVMLEPGAEIEVMACRIRDGYIYDLYLAGDQWIEGHLPMATKEEATKVVNHWLQKATPPAPTVVLKRNVGEYWIIDLHVTVDGIRRSAVEMLREKELLLN